MSAIDGSIQKKKKKMHGSGTTTLVISNDELNGIMKIIKSLENSGIFLKGVTKTIKNQTKEQKGGFLSMLLGTLGASLLGNLLLGKRFLRAGEGTVRIGEGIKKKALMPRLPLTNFKIIKYYNNNPRFNGVYSRDNLPKIIKNGGYIVNLDEYEVVGTHWISLHLRELHSKSNIFLKKLKNLLETKISKQIFLGSNDTIQ